MSLPRSFFARPALVVAPELLGCLLTHEGVTVRLTEVEAYAGEGADPGSHAFRGRTPRTEVMFGEAGHLYVYFSYGMHWCANAVCGDEGVAQAVLLRAGEVVAGHELAASRRPGLRERDSLAPREAKLEGVGVRAPLRAQVQGAEQRFEQLLARGLDRCTGRGQEFARRRGFGRSAHGQ